MKKRLPISLWLVCLCLLSPALFSCNNHPSTVILHSSLGEMTVDVFRNIPPEAAQALSALQSDTLAIDRILHDGYIRLNVQGTEPNAAIPRSIPVSGSLMYCRGRFYLVQGREHSDASLDRWEQANGRRVAPEAREAYKQQGGALQLENLGIAVGALRHGREALDRIAALPSDAEGRPLRALPLQAEMK